MTVLGLGSSLLVIIIIIIIIIYKTQQILTVFGLGSSLLHSKKFCVETTYKICHIDAIEITFDFCYCNSEFLLYLHVQICCFECKNVIFTQINCYLNTFDVNTTVLQMLY